MKRLTIVALAGAAILSGCAAPGPTTQGNNVASRDDAPIGSYIKSKSSTTVQNTTNANMQDLENARIQGAGLNMMNN